MMKADFIVELRYFTAEEGGRSTPAFSGYRPCIKFPFETMQTSGQQIFLGKDLVCPGDLATAEIAIIAIEIFRGKLGVGQVFDFREGSKIIGTGTITEIVNPELDLKNEPGNF